jgi:hypothetical protein
LQSNLIREILREPGCVPFHRLIDHFGRDAIKLREILVEHYALAANNVNPLFDYLGREFREQGFLGMVFR